MNQTQVALDVVNHLRTLADSIETLVITMTVEETKKENEKTPLPTQIEEKEPTLEEVRAAMADKSRDGHREAVKAIITKYGANNLSSLDPKHYAAALKEVGEIK